MPARPLAVPTSSRANRSSTQWEPPSRRPPYCALRPARAAAACASATGAEAFVFRSARRSGDLQLVAPAANPLVPPSERETQGEEGQPSQDQPSQDAAPDVYEPPVAEPAESPAVEEPDPDQVGLVEHEEEPAVEEPDPEQVGLVQHEEEPQAEARPPFRLTGRWRPLPPPGIAASRAVLAAATILWRSAGDEEAAHAATIALMETAFHSSHPTVALQAAVAMIDQQVAGPTEWEIAMATCRDLLPVGSLPADRLAAALTVAIQRSREASNANPPNVATWDPRIHFGSNLFVPNTRVFHLVDVQTRRGTRIPTWFRATVLECTHDRGVYWLTLSYDLYAGYGHGIEHEEDDKINAERHFANGSLRIYAHPYPMLGRRHRFEVHLETNGFVSPN